MRLSLLWEMATTVWVGPMKPILGTGEDYTLNYGGMAGRPPFLFVPLPLQLIRDGIKYLSKNKLGYWHKGNGTILPFKDMDHLQALIKQLPKDADYIINPGQRMTHVGEAHLTISMGPELTTALGDDPIATLRRTSVGGIPLFDARGRGIQVTLERTQQWRVFRAKFYEDEADVGGPLLVCEVIKIQRHPLIRLALGMAEKPTLPGVTNYVPHLTYGYIPAKNIIHKSYVEKMGSKPRFVKRQPAKHGWQKQPLPGKQDYGVHGQEVAGTEADYQPKG